jgi:hypothetical protein
MSPAGNGGGPSPTPKRLPELIPDVIEIADLARVYRACAEGHADRKATGQPDKKLHGSGDARRRRHRRVEARGLPVADEAGFLGG